MFGVREFEVMYVTSREWRSYYQKEKFLFVYYVHSSIPNINEYQHSTQSTNTSSNSQSNIENREILPEYSKFPFTIIHMCAITTGC